MGLLLEPSGTQGGRGEGVARARVKDGADKVYQEPTDFMPMGGQSPQSRQLIENQGSKTGFSPAKAVNIMKRKPLTITHGK